MKVRATCNFKPLLSRSLQRLSPLFFSFVVFPEFQSFEPRANQKFGWPSQVDSEYSSDVLTYQKPFQWESDFFSQTKAFDLSTGSLSGKEFLVQDRLRIHHHLTESLEFRFTYFRQGDWEIDQNAQILELAYWFSKKWGVSAYGEVFRDKANNNAGLALLYKPNEQSEWRAYLTQIEFSRNQRNSEPDRFLQEPIKYGFIGRQFFEQGFFQVWAHNEPRSSLLIPQQEQRVLNHQGWQSGVFWAPNEVSWWNPRFEFVFDRFHSDEQLDTGFQVFDQRRLQARIEWEKWLGPHRLRPGVAFFYRQYSMDEATSLFSDQLPFVWFLMNRTYRTNFVWEHELGLEMTRSQGRFALEMAMDRPERQDRYEGRLNYRSQFSFKDYGDLALLFTFDLDEFGSGRTWEGGNVQFRAYF